MSKNLSRIEELIENEILIIENSGEMPEVALHGSLHHLTVAQDGPLLSLEQFDILSLKSAVAEAYKKIILRDLTLENRNKGLYRGLERCTVNLNRMISFCQKEDLDFADMIAEIRLALRYFFEGEAHDVIHLKKETCINCSIDRIHDLLEKLEVDSDFLPRGWDTLIP